MVAAALALLPFSGSAQEASPWSTSVVVRVAAGPAIEPPLRACMEDTLLKISGVSLSAEAETEISIRIHNESPLLASVVVGTRMPSALIDHLIEKQVDPTAGRLLSLFQLVEGQSAVVARDVATLCQRIVQTVDADVFAVQRRVQEGGGARTGP